MKNRIRTLFAAGAFAAVAAGGASAHAAGSSVIGYLCGVNVQFSSNTVATSIFSGPGCSGSELGYFQFTQSGTPNSCPASSSPSATMMPILTDNLLEHFRAGKEVQVFTVGSPSPSYCISGINFLQ